MCVCVYVCACFTLAWWVREAGLVVFGSAFRPCSVWFGVASPSGALQLLWLCGHLTPAAPPSPHAGTPTRSTPGMP